MKGFRFPHSMGSMSNVIVIAEFLCLDVLMYSGFEGGLLQLHPGINEDRLSPRLRGSMSCVCLAGLDGH